MDTSYLAFLSTITRRIITLARARRATEPPGQAMMSSLMGHDKLISNMIMHRSRPMG